MARLNIRKKFIINKRKTKLKKGDKIVLLIVLVVFSIMLAFKYINKQVTPLLMNYAEAEIRKLSSLVINRAITKQMTSEMTVDELFIISKNDKGEIKSVDFNPLIVNKILSKATSSVQLDLKYIEEGKIDLLELPDDVLIEYDKDKLKKGIIYEIPSGVIFKNNILANIGPKIPVKLSLVGSITSSVKTNIKDYGINNALIEILINISIEEQVILPFASKKIKVENNVPVALKLIQGNIPNYYFNGTNNAPSFTLPIE